MKFSTNLMFACAALTMASACTAQETTSVAVQKAVEKQETKAPAQAIEKATEVKKDVVQNIQTTKDGQLVGQVFTSIDGSKTLVDAKVTLSADGVVVEAVQAENGSFSFANVSPGSYTLTGSATGLVGGQALQVDPYAGGFSSASLGLQPVNEVACDVPSAVYNAPASSCGCGGGGGGFGGGLLGNRRLLRLGLIGGIFAIAVSSDDDVSADE